MNFRIKNKATILFTATIGAFFVAQIYAAPGDKTDVGSVSAVRHKRLSSATLDYNRMPNRVVVQDSLTSASSTEALSAKQGKNLKAIQDNYSTAQAAKDEAQDSNINARLATSTAAATYKTLEGFNDYSAAQHAKRIAHKTADDHPQYHNDTRGDARYQKSTLTGLSGDATLRTNNTYIANATGRLTLANYSTGRIVLFTNYSARLIPGQSSMQVKWTHPSTFTGYTTSAGWSVKIPVNTYLELVSLGSPMWQAIMTTQHLVKTGIDEFNALPSATIVITNLVP